MKTTAKAVPVTIGLDIAKNFFQVHAVDAAGEVVLRRKLMLRSGEVYRSARSTTTTAVAAQVAA